MIKILIIIIIVILFAVFGVNLIKSDKSPVNNVPGSNNLSNPSGAIEGAKDAVQQSQNAQDKVNKYADELQR